MALVLPRRAQPHAMPPTFTIPLRLAGRLNAHNAINSNKLGPGAAQGRWASSSRSTLVSGSRLARS